MKCSAFALFAGSSAELTRVPGGRVLDSECIIEVPNGKVVDADRMKRRDACQSTTGLGVQIYASDVHVQSKEPLTSFTANWVVPALPKRDYGQTVYFWPGFKAQKPEMGLPVLQPVLQYGQTGGASWQLQSWFVWGNSGDSVTAPAITVQPGDQITSYMSQSADGKMWTVSGTDLTTGEDSTLNVKYSEAGNTDYDFAMLVNENIEVNHWCSLMPADETELVFTNVTVNGQVPAWTTRANCKGDPTCDCDNSATVDDAGDVHLGWNSEKPTHYNQECLADEKLVEVLDGTVCAVKCASSDDCPVDVPLGTGATPKCSLKNLDGYCGLQCGRDSGCPDGARCKKGTFSLSGVCVFPSSLVVV